MKPLVFIISLSILSVTTYCQSKENRLINQKSAGILVEYGQPYYYLPEGYRYYTLLNGVTFSMPFYQAKKFFNVSFDVFPHIGFAWLNQLRYSEMGINVRVGFNFELAKNAVLSAKIASGPHWINVETEKQASGFIFSDYYLLCFDKGFFISQQKFALELEFGYRHISNAGLKQPNRSISNFIFGLGISKVFN